MGPGGALVLCANVKPAAAHFFKSRLLTHNAEQFPSNMDVSLIAIWSLLMENWRPQLYQLT